MTINEPSQFRKELTQFPRHALVTPQAWRAPRRRTRSRRRSQSARRAITDRSHDLGRAGLGLGRRYEARPDSPRTRHGAHSWTLSKVFSFRFDDSWANISIPCSHRPSIESQTGNGRRARPGRSRGCSMDASGRSRETRAAAVVAHTHTHTSTPETRPRRSRRRATKITTQKTLSFSVFHKGTRDDFAPLGECTLESHSWILFVLVVLPVVESMLGRRTSRAIVFAADGRARREIQPSNHRLKPGDATRRYESATARATRPHTTNTRCINTIERT